MAIPRPHKVRPPTHQRFHRWRRALQVGASILIVLAPFLGLLRFDVPGRSLILLRVEFSLQEIAPIFGLLMLAMLAIFAGALIYGRLWCGWACPQTVLSELASFFDRRVVGKKPTPARRAAAVALQLGVAAFVAASIVSYFVPPELYLAPPLVAWVSWLITTGIIAADLLFLRHRFCVGICPYGILQGIVADNKTLRVEMDQARADECVSCKACVRACFMGVDVRDPAGDLACIACGDCIDAAMGSVVCPEGLIRYHFHRDGSTWPGWLVKLGVSDGRRALIAIALPVLAVGLMGMLAGRESLETRFSNRYEEAALDEAGVARNHFAVTLGNRRNEPVEVRLELEGLEGLYVESPGPTVHLEANERRRFDLVLALEKGALEAGSYPIEIHAVVGGSAAEDGYSAPFFVPGSAR